MKKFILTLIMVLTLTFFVNAQEDASGCKDHKLLTRLENFYISECAENYNEIKVLLKKNKTESKEGNLFHYYYRYNFDAGVKAKSVLQIIKNYEAAITKNGGKLIYKNTNGNDGPLEATYFLSTKEKDYWVQLNSFAGNGVDVEAYGLNILEMEVMKQEVVAGEMFENLNKNGSIALYINFESGKSTIKEESFSIINQVFEMLKLNPDLKISIEGHTDDVGTEQSNQTLSESRAKTVMNELVSKGISANRLKSKGWGQSKPITDNKTDDGKAKNRRVEIVKQ